MQTVRRPRTHVQRTFYYRAMHYSAKRGLAIACRLSVCLSVRLSGDTRGGVGKVACWSTKAAISLKRVKIEEKLLWRAYRKSPTLFRMVPSTTPYDLLFPYTRVHNPTKTPIAIISGTARDTHFIFSMHIQKLSGHSYIRRIARSSL